MQVLYIKYTCILMFMDNTTYYVHIFHDDGKLYLYFVYRFRFPSAQAAKASAFDFVRCGSSSTPLDVHGALVLSTTRTSMPASGYPNAHTPDLSTYQGIIWCETVRGIEHKRARKKHQACARQASKLN